MRIRTYIAVSLSSLLLTGAFACSDSESTGARNLPGADAGALTDAGAASDADVFPRDAGSASDAGAAFDAATRDAGAPNPDVCDPVTQLDCPMSGQKCVVEGPVGGTQCTDADPADFPLGAACEGRDCEAGLACVHATTTSTASECVKVCDFMSGDGCEGLPGDFECRDRLNGSNWGACSELPPICNPYTQAPCDAALACQPFLRRTGVWEFRCRAAGDGQAGAPCGPGSGTTCARSLACVSSRTGAAFCQKICEVNTDCENQAQCSGVVSEPPFMHCSE